MATPTTWNPRTASYCLCCSSIIDVHDDCACSCDADQMRADGRSYCTERSGCEYAESPPISATLEAELAELLAERELEANPFPRG